MHVRLTPFQPECLNQEGNLAECGAMLVDSLVLVVGLALIIKGGDWFVGASVRLAELWHMPRVVIGSTLVSLATTTPELAVSLMAGSRGESGLAVGNAIGSCICNVGLILGVTAALRQVPVHPKALRIPLVAMFGFGALLCLMTLDLKLDGTQGALLTAGGLGYFIWDFFHHARDRGPAEVTEARAIEQSVTGRLSWFESRAGSMAQFLAGAGVVVAGSWLLVGAAVDLARALGIPSIIVGLTVVAVGTSVPELVTAVTSSRKNVSDLAVGNVLGANIANLTFIVGVAAMLSELRMSRATQLVNFPAMLVVFGLLLWMLLNDRQLSRKEGVALLFTYSVYLCALVLLAARLKK
jgi:cation:H+ antiporter